MPSNIIHTSTAPLFLKQACSSPSNLNLAFSYNLQHPMLATLTLHLHIPACASLKEKRSQIKPLISRLHREFNISVAEIDLNDKWDQTIIACAMIGNDHNFLQSALQTVAKWVAGNWRNGEVWDTKIEIF